MEKHFSLTNNKGQYLDDILDTNIFNKKINGFFIELGGYDGITQSNTAFFEFYRNWKGILIEPSYDKYLECIKNRPLSKCYHNACSESSDIKYLNGDWGSLMSSVDGKRLNRNNLVKQVNAITLNEIIQNYINTNNISNLNIDLLSLDTEGYELNILHGLDLNKFRPNYMIIEVYNYDYDKIKNHLNNNNYELLMNISNYNKTDNQIWDGTHNDYLFKDINFTKN